MNRFRCSCEIMKLSQKNECPEMILQKHSKCERMSGCNYSFIIEKGQFIEWMAATELAN